MLLDQSAILDLGTAKFKKEVVSLLLIWTLPVQCRLFFSLSICSSQVLALYFDFKLWHTINHVQPIHLTFYFLFGDLLGHNELFQKLPFRKMWSVTMKGQCKHEVFQELLIKKSIWKLLCAFAFVILISKRNFVRFVCL